MRRELPPHPVRRARRSVRRGAAPRLAYRSARDLAPRGRRRAARRVPGTMWPRLAVVRHEARARRATRTRRGMDGRARATAGARGARGRTGDGARDATRPSWATWARMGHHLIGHGGPANSAAIAAGYSSWPTRDTMNRSEPAGTISHTPWCVSECLTGKKWRAWWPTLARRVTSDSRNGNAGPSCPDPTWSTRATRPGGAVRPT